MFKYLIDSVIIASAGASNRIAGNNLTDEEVAVIYKSLRIQKLKPKQSQDFLQSYSALALLNGDSIEQLLSPKQLSLWLWALQNSNTEFSRKDAVTALGFPERTIEASINKLVALKRLQRLGAGPATRYKVINQS